MTKVLVTGGCGFIGSHLVDKLVLKNYEVRVIDNLSADNEQFYYNPKAEYEHFDVQNTKDLIEYSKGCKYIFHLAAESRLGKSIENPRYAIDANIKGTVSVLESAKENQSKIVFSSTSSIYGLNSNFPLKETEPEDCLNAYSSTKYCAELFLRNYYDLYRVESVILRYFNVFGERAPSTGMYALVTGIFLNQLSNNLPLTITGNGLQERDFVYVGDVADANIKCTESNILWNADIYNIGCGYTHNIKTLAETLSSNIEYIEPRKGEAKINLSDVTKFKQTTGWTPSVDVLDWIKQFKM